MKTKYIIEKNFLNNFSLDYSKLTKQLEEIMESKFFTLGIKREMTISFDESKLFGKSASVSKTNISFNKTRIEMLLDLKIDDTDAAHLENVESFYEHYGENENHSTFEENLYNFMKKYKEIGAEWAFEFMGSYKMIKYELLDTILHETEHVYQDEFKKYLHENIFPVDKRSKVLIFTVLFTEMFEKLQKSGVKLDYNRENYIYPIEFDARYESLRQMSEIKNLYFPNNADFSIHLVKSNLLPKNFNVEQTAVQIFNDYEKIYKLYKQNFGDEFENINKFIKSNKKSLIAEFGRRYNEMINISLGEKYDAKSCDRQNGI